MQSHFQRFLDIVQQQPERQDALPAQMRDLQALAMRLGMYSAASALTALAQGREPDRYPGYTAVTTLPEQYVIVEVLYDSGFVGYSWREGGDPAMGSAAFDQNHGNVVGWKALRPGQVADQETIDFHCEMMKTVKSRKSDAT